MRYVLTLVIALLFSGVAAAQEDRGLCVHKEERFESCIRACSVSEKGKGFTQCVKALCQPILHICRRYPPREIATPKGSIR